MEWIILSLIKGILDMMPGGFGLTILYILAEAISGGWDGGTLLNLISIVVLGVGVRREALEYQTKNAIKTAPAEEQLKELDKLIEGLEELKKQIKQNKTQSKQTLGSENEEMKQVAISGHASQDCSIINGDINDGVNDDLVYIMADTSAIYLPAFGFTDPMFLFFVFFIGLSIYLFKTQLK